MLGLGWNVSGMPADGSSDPCASETGCGQVGFAPNLKVEPAPKLSRPPAVSYLCRSWEVRPSLIAKARGREEDCPAADAIAGAARQGQGAGGVGVHSLTVGCSYAIDSWGALRGCSQLS